MAYDVVSVAILLVLLLQSASSYEASSVAVTGSISCPDCTSRRQLAGLRVVIKCGRAKQAIGTLTDNTGAFKVNLSSSLLHDMAPCYAMLLSGSNRQCKFEGGHNIARIVDGRLTSPLTFSPFSCPGKPSQGLKPGGSQGAELGDSKTIDLPLPPEWGLPPTSYYTYPIIPIGIP
ncbi:hypothetical protein EJ110_NYTH41879 [Nymphaea thermarum]|nr:hypothetical protein EJ110_NYTH41879 [Nymphaea thermarum]